MQFIPHGPDIPDDMLQAHEEGRLVFFCGAGISKPAGLPDFSQLVDNVCEKIGTHLQEPEKKPLTMDSTTGRSCCWKGVSPAARSRCARQCGNACNRPFPISLT